MLRKRTIALIVLLLTIGVACIFVRQNEARELVNKPGFINHEPTKPIPKPTPPNNNPIPEPSPVNEVPGEKSIDEACYIGGCSNQLCTDSNEMVSTCEWRESYACYRTATCERQQSGQCGWTETSELKSCLREAESDVFLEAKILPR
jgi:hypothetical protein